MDKDEADKRQILKNELDKIPCPDMDVRNLCEILYTASELYMTNLDNIATSDAIKIWKMVELAKKISDEKLEEIKL